MLPQCPAFSHHYRYHQKLEQVEALQGAISNSIITAMLLAIPTRKSISPISPPPVLALIRLKCRLCCLLLRDWDCKHLHNEYKRLAKAIEEAIRNHKTTKLNTLCDRTEDDFSCHPTAFWKTIKHLNSTSSPDSPLFRDKRLFVGDAERVDVFCSELQQAHRYPEHPDFDGIAQTTIIAYLRTRWTYLPHFIECTTPTRTH